MKRANPKKKKVDSDVEDLLKGAFDRTDELGGRLDQLKETYNDMARRLTPIRTQVVRAAFPSIPSEGPVPVFPPSQPTLPGLSGRYSGPVPLPERLPVSKATQGSSERRKSGRFFLQIADARDPKELRRIRERLSSAGRVVDSGMGTASDPSAGWVELAIPFDEVPTIRDRLGQLHLTERTEKLIEVQPGEGRLHAKQIDLFLEGGKSK